MIYLSRFSHIYVEHGAYEYPLTRQILDRLRGSTVIDIPHYKDFFNRPGQCAETQKRSQKLILAVRTGRFLYPGSAMCQNSYNKDLGEPYYTTQMMNCIYNCGYCFLNGMYRTGNMVAFVNQQDYFDSMPKNQKLFVNLSYESDLMAVEHIFGYISEWVEFVKNSAGIIIEIRTKSGAFNEISHIKPVPGVILAWSVMPDAYIKQYETKTPALQTRLDNASAAVELGWNVRLCIDPVMLAINWEHEYSEMIGAIHSSLNMGRLFDIIVGGFRMPKTFYRRIYGNNPATHISALPLAEKNGIICYTEENEAMMQNFFKGLTHK